MEKYRIPQELADLQTSARAHEELRKLYVKLPFGYKKALKNSLECERLRTEFWAKVQKLHPALVGKKLNHPGGTLYITILED